MPDKRIIFNNYERHPQYMKNQTSRIPIGWCSHNAHRGKLSLKQMRKHNCRGKNCQFFKKNDDHPHWKQKARVKQAKRTERFKLKMTETLKAEILKALNNLERNKNG